MNIYNATPHEIHVYHPSQYEFNPKVRKRFLLPGESPVLSVPRSGRVLSVDFEIQDTDLTISGIKIKKQVVSSASLPDEIFPKFNKYKDFAIVSALYVDGLRRLGLNKEFQLLCASGIVYSNPLQPHPVGCTDIVLK